MIHGTVGNTDSLSISKTFKGAFWLPNGHSQTLWRKFAGSEYIAHKRERIELPDGDFIDLDWAAQLLPQPGNENSEKPIVLIIHGLCGCSGSSYVLALQKELLQNDIPSVAMNLRGCSGEPNRKARTYHSGVSDDLQAVFCYLAQQHPARAIAVVGYSLGGNVLLKWLGEIGQEEQLDVPLKAAAVSTPFTLGLCSQQMLSGFSKLYGRYFTRRLLESLETKKALFRKDGNHAELEKLESLGPVNSIQSIWDFDQQITAPLHGFNSAEDYYSQCSSIGFLSTIKVPTLLLHSFNDPMIPPPALPSSEQLSSQVEFDLQQHGGHVGFVARSKEPWLEQRLLHFIMN